MKRYDTIQALRALAANMVVVFHLIALNARIDASWRAWETPLANLGSAGVQCFFVISGFVITTVARRETWQLFLFSRVTRIYPIYWVYLALMIGFYVAKGSPPTSSSILHSIFLFPDQVPLILPVSWSLVYEMYFYIVLAAAIALRARLVWLFAVWTVLLLASQVMVPAAGEGMLQVVTHPYTLEFIAGGMIALMPVRRFGWAVLMVGIIGAMLGQIAGALEAPAAPAIAKLLVGAPFVAIVYGAVALETGQRVAVPRWIVALGDASYSTYLSHFLLLAALTRLFSPQSSGGLIVEAVFAVLCVVAANAWGVFSYQRFEVPIMAFSKRIAPRRQSVVAAA